MPEADGRYHVIIEAIRVRLKQAKAADDSNERSKCLTYHAWLLIVSLRVNGKSLAQKMKWEPESGNLDWTLPSPIKLPVNSKVSLEWKLTSYNSDSQITDFEDIYTLATIEHQGDQVATTEFCKEHDAATLTYGL